jgi:hypothetical protein
MDSPEKEKEERQLSSSNRLDHPKPKRPPDRLRILMMLFEMMGHTADLVGRYVGRRMVVRIGVGIWCPMRNDRGWRSESTHYWRLG